MRLDLATAEYIGARAQQQDLAAAVPVPGGAVLVLADGLGGHESGAEASRIVVETFKEAGTSGKFANQGTRRQALRETVDRANARIAEGVDPSHGHRGMASTVVAAVVVEGEVNWVSVGDSHLYVWRGGRLNKLNEDHSQAGLMVRSGQYHPSDPEVQAVKSVLVSALTGRKLEIVDLPQRAFKLEPGDVLILASDGLNTLEDEEIERIVAEVRGQGAVRLSTTLLEQVRSRRIERQDNTTVAIARILPAKVDALDLPRPEPAAMQRRTPNGPALDDASEARTERVSAPLDFPESRLPPERQAARHQATIPQAKDPVVEVPASKDGPGEGGEPSPAAEPVPDVTSATETAKPIGGREARNRPAPDDRPVATEQVGADGAPGTHTIGRPLVTKAPLDAKLESDQPGGFRIARAIAGLLLIWLIAGLITIASIAAWRPEWLNGWLPGFAAAPTPPTKPNVRQPSPPEPAAQPPAGQSGEANPAAGPAATLPTQAGVPVDASPGPAIPSGEAPPQQPSIAPASQSTDPALVEPPRAATRPASPR